MDTFLDSLVETSTYGVIKKVEGGFGSPLYIIHIAYYSCYINKLNMSRIWKWFV